MQESGKIRHERLRRLEQIVRGHKIAVRHVSASRVLSGNSTPNSSRVAAYRPPANAPVRADETRELIRKM
jgi:hypothetical protein